MKKENILEKKQMLHKKVNKINPSRKNATIRTIEIMQHDEGQSLVHDKK